MKSVTLRAQEVKGYVEKWRARMRLTHWDITVTVRAANKNTAQRTVADCAARPRYMEADLTVYPFLWEHETSTAKARESTIVHELSHIILSELDSLYERLRDGVAVNTDQWNDALERATESVARAVVGGRVS